MLMLFRLMNAHEATQALFASGAVPHVSWRAFALGRVDLLTGTITDSPRPETFSLYVSPLAGPELIQREATRAYHAFMDTMEKADAVAV